LLVNEKKELQNEVENLDKINKCLIEQLKQKLIEKSE
jgi:hypothetical protein